MRGLTTLTAAGLIATTLVATPAASAHRPAAAADQPPIAAGADFNQDGYADVVTGLPDTAVNGRAKAGAVQVIYGGGAGSVVITQDSTDVPDEAEAGDLFGKAVTVWYSPYDNYPNLVVGAPGESVGTAAAAGQVFVFQGGPDGLVLGGYTYNQDSGGVPGTAEAGDQFGWSLSGGEPGGGFRYGTLAIGSPGEDHNATNSGSVTLIGNERVRVVHQDSPGIPGKQENGDRFGWSVAILRDVLVVGVPYESIGSVAGAGLVQIMTVRREDTPNTDWPKPQKVADLDQGKAGVSGVPETGDHFGMSVALASGEGGESSDYSVTVGVPDESIGSVARAGGMHAFHLEDPYGDLHPNLLQNMSVNQNSAGVPGVAETGDRFGSSVDAVTNVYGTVVHTVGSDGEVTDGQIGSSDAIHVFSLQLTGAAWVRPGRYGIAGGETLGTGHLNGDGSRLYIAAPTAGRIIAVPWENIFYGAGETIEVYEA
ncbi:hypothetical protein AB0I28_00680 [Phytomonospora sp. NPDC050363]|uniref:hypothetical protein n=1 Tax=Phytomonospora sp. NPDC050363 TaxID=3155642 RepID=UPI0033E0FEF4